MSGPFRGKTKITDVRRAHDEYGQELVRWGENNLVTVRALTRYWDLRKAWESENPGKAYKR